MFVNQPKNYAEEKQMFSDIYSIPSIYVYKHEIISQCFLYLAKDNKRMSRTSLISIRGPDWRHLQ